MAPLNTSEEMFSDRGAEFAIANIVIRDIMKVFRVLKVLEYADFFSPGVKLLLWAIRQEALTRSKENTDPVANLVRIREILTKSKKWVPGETVKFMEEVTQARALTSDLNYYMRIVKEFSLRRKVQVAAEKLQRDIKEQAPIDEIITQVNTLNDKLATRTVESHAMNLKSLNDAFFESESYKGKKLKTGVIPLDNALGGLERSTVIVVAGRPSMGKTSLAMNIATFMSMQNLRIYVFSIEMTVEQIVNRIVSSITSVPFESIEKNLMSDEQRRIVKEAKSYLTSLDMIVDPCIYKSAISPDKIRSVLKQTCAHKPVDCVMIDYLQLMKSPKSKDGRQNEVAEMSRQIKQIAKEFDVPVMLLSQVNRAAEGRKSNRPRLSDLRESGSIEQDADVVLMLHREGYYRVRQFGGVDDGEAECIIAKNKMGEVGSVKMLFDGACFLFKELPE